MKMQNYLQSPLSKVYRPQKNSDLTSKLAKTFGLILFGAACFYAGKKYDSIVNYFKQDNSTKTQYQMQYAPNLRKDSEETKKNRQKR